MLPSHETTDYCCCCFSISFWRCRKAASSCSSDIPYYKTQTHTMLTCSLHSTNYVLYTQACFITQNNTLFMADNATHTQILVQHCQMQMCCSCKRKNKHHTTAPCRFCDCKYRAEMHASKPANNCIPCEAASRTCRT